MKPEHLLAALLLLACTAVDLGVVGEVLANQTAWPKFPGILGLGLALGQASVITFWLVWGSGHLLLRVSAAFVILLALSFMASISTAGTPREVGQWFGAILIYLALLATVLMICRLLKVRLAQREEFPPQQVSRLASWQFSIGSLLVAMSATGVIITVLRHVEFPAREIVAVGVFFLILTVFSCILMVVSLISRRIWPAGLLIVAISPGVGFVLSATGFPPREMWLELTLMTGVTGLTILTLLAVLRTTGWRLEWASPDENARESG